MALHRKWPLTVTFLMFITVRIIGRPCDLSSSDLLLIIQSSFDIDKYDFEDIKAFASSFMDDLSIGAAEKAGLLSYCKKKKPSFLRTPMYQCMFH